MDVVDKEPDTRGPGWNGAWAGVDFVISAGQKVLHIQRQHLNTDCNDHEADPSEAGFRVWIQQ